MKRDQATDNCFPVGDIHHAVQARSNRRGLTFLVYE